MYCRYIVLKKSNFVNKNKKPLAIIESRTKHKNLSQRFLITSSSHLHIKEAIRKVHIQLKIPSGLNVVQNVLTWKAPMHRPKSIFFYQFTLLWTNLELISYLSGMYLNSWFSWFGRGVKKTSKEKKKTGWGKTFKYEEKEKQRTQWKSNNSNKHLWFYLSYKRSYFIQKLNLKKK